MLMRGVNKNFLAFILFWEIDTSKSLLRTYPTLQFFTYFTCYLVRTDVNLASQKKIFPFFLKGQFDKSFWIKILHHIIYNPSYLSVQFLSRLLVCKVKILKEIIIFGILNWRSKQFSFEEIPTTKPLLGPFTNKVFSKKSYLGGKSLLYH